MQARKMLYPDLSTAETVPWDWIMVLTDGVREEDGVTPDWVLHHKSFSAIHIFMFFGGIFYLFSSLFFVDWLGRHRVILKSHPLSILHSTCELAGLE